MPSTSFLDGACRLHDQGVIRASGADAATFLQGQLTNDVMTLGLAGARLAGFCSAKGRLQASFIVWREDSDTFLLACSKSLLAPTLKRLSMFILRAKCKLSDASSEVTLCGVSGAPAIALFDDAMVWSKHEHGSNVIVRLPDGAGRKRCVVAMPAGENIDSLAAPALSLDAWHWLEVQSGIVSIDAATVDRFVPQMVNYELVGGVDFQKGCYPGQEVVARSQYRGTTKRRTFLFDCDAIPAAGQDVFAVDPGGTNPGSAEAVGTVANGAPHPVERGGSALVEVRLAALGQGSLRLGAADGPVLRRTELPYPVALEAEPAL
ncbi:MAG: folate-binding protein [Caldimonas sp.]